MIAPPFAFLACLTCGTRFGTVAIDVLLFAFPARGVVCPVRVRGCFPGWRRRQTRSRSGHHHRRRSTVERFSRLRWAAPLHFLVASRAVVVIPRLLLPFDFLPLSPHLLILVGDRSLFPLHLFLSPSNDLVFVLIFVRLHHCLLDRCQRTLHACHRAVVLRSLPRFSLRRFVGPIVCFRFEVNHHRHWRRTLCLPRLTFSEFPLPLNGLR